MLLEVQELQTHVLWPRTASCRFFSPVRLAAAVAFRWLPSAAASFPVAVLLLPLLMLPPAMLLLLPLWLTLPPPLPPILNPSMTGWQPLQT